MVPKCITLNAINVYIWFKLTISYVTLAKTIVFLNCEKCDYWFDSKSKSSSQIFYKWGNGSSATATKQKELTS